MNNNTTYICNEDIENSKTIIESKIKNIEHKSNIKDNIKINYLHLKDRINRETFHIGC